MKNLMIAFLLFAVIGCKKNEPEPMVDETPTDSIPTVVETPKTNTDIIAGQSVGNVSLEMDSQRLEPILGKPDLSDSAMGKSWMTWYSTNSNADSGKSELNVFTTYKDDEMKQKVVKLVRVTSPDFKIDSLGSGNSFDEIKAKFPNMKYVGDYAFEKTKDFVEIYDSENDGISFEFLNSTKSCIAIIIHSNGESVLLPYRTFRPDMTLKD
ncbi:MAG: hypothetical protein EOO50_10970 [Flavobacterium sp.]|uniref:hypothetical protein n=1 Tax=Flavobacterium sp. TaxID=239 RepID=UPI001226EDA8|nr:hypothetical protein [Flavobacterium sp.]RZJ66178.1 MAG: hypothetical protein EOO50_10970 [Flavobacterium sp.]